MTSGVVRRAATAVLFGTIVVGSLEHALDVARNPPRLGPYDRFVDEVLPRTREGASVVVVARGSKWRHYSPFFGIALYRLRGRLVLPAMSSDERPLTPHLRNADYALYWRVPPSPDRPVLWRDGHGVLAGR